MGDRFLQRAWQPEAANEGVNWKELRVLGCAINVWSDVVKDGLVLVRIDNNAAALYANRGAGGSFALTMLAGGVRVCCVAPHSVADPPSRFELCSDGHDPFSGRQLRVKFCKLVQKECGRMDVDMTVFDLADNARRTAFRSASSTTRR